MPKTLRPHGTTSVEFMPSPFPDFPSFRLVEVTSTDDNGNLVSTVESRKIEFDPNITADDFNLINIIKSGSIGLLKPVAPIKQGSLAGADIVTSALDNLDSSKIINIEN